MPRAFRQRTFGQRTFSGRVFGRLLESGTQLVTRFVALLERTLLQPLDIRYDLRPAQEAVRALAIDSMVNTAARGAASPTLSALDYQVRCKPLGGVRVNAINDLMEVT